MDTEADWVVAAQAGDRGAFAQLVDLYQRPVYSLAYRMLGNPADAEDAAQETFLKAYRSLSAFDRARPFSTWLLSIAAHHCIDRLRRKRMREVSLDALPPWRWLPAETVDPEHAAERADHASRIEALLDTLPPDYRVVVVLRYWHDLGYSEIADVLGDTESAVKSRLHRARRLLADALALEPGTARPGSPGGPGAKRPAPSETMGGMTGCSAAMHAA
jgi:RNA polymerase sigma-70 factor (ECF subfamily)